MTTTDASSVGTDEFSPLSEDDRQRMARLYEEVQGRLKEMSLIISRTLGMQLSDSTRVMLRPREGEEADAPGNHVEVHCTLMPDGHFECGCYDYDAGTCGPC